MVYVFVFVFYASLNQVSKYPCQSKDMNNKYSYPCFGCLFMYNHMLFTCESICQHLFLQKGLYLFFYLVSCPCVSVTLNVNTTVLFFSCGQGSREFWAHGGIRGWLLVVGWMDFSGGESSGAVWWMMVRGFSSPPPLLFPSPQTPCH